MRIKMARISQSALRSFFNTLEFAHVESYTRGLILNLARPAYTLYNDSHEMMAFTNHNTHRPTPVDCANYYDLHHRSTNQDPIPVLSRSRGTRDFPNKKQ